MENHPVAFKIPGVSGKSLPRAISFSELPTRRRIVIQKSEISGELMRQYSCEQIYDKATNTRQISFVTSITSKLDPQNTRWNPTASIFNRPFGWHQRIPSGCVQPEYSHQKPPMDMDSLKISNSPKKMSRSPKKTIASAEFTASSNHSDAHKIIPPKVLAYTSHSDESSSDTSEKDTNLTGMTKKIRPLIATEFSKLPKRRVSLNKFELFGLISVVVLIVSTIILEGNQSPLDFTNTTMELRKNVLGQSEAMDALFDHLQSNFDNFSVAILLGGMGVGKTYTANIIKNNFPYKNNIFEYFPPIKKLMPSAYGLLSPCRCNLLILENLRAEDARDFMNFAKFIHEQKKHPCVIILGILNPQVTDEYLTKTMDLKKAVEELQNLFTEKEIKGRIIQFKPLGPDIIGECIMREVRDRDVVLDEGDFQEIKAQLVMMDSGCKGIHGKVNLLGKKEIA